MATAQRVTGIGGIFFKARDPQALAAWYREHLGVPLPVGETYATFSVGGNGTDATGAPLETVWSIFPLTSSYFEQSRAPFMVNYRVGDLEAMLAQLRAAGALVDERVEVSSYGRFGWALDPEGNRFELWQPPASGLPPP